MYAIAFLKIKDDLQFVFLLSCFVGDLKGKFEPTKTQQNVGGGRGGLILASLLVTFSFLAKWLLFLKHVVLMVLGTFPYAFSQGFFKTCCLYGVGYIPVCIFPRVF